MGFLRRVHGVTLRNKVHSCEIRRGLNVRPLSREPSYVRFGHMSGISHERLARQVLLARPTGKRPRGRPKTRWSDYISDLAWSRLGVEPAELPEITVDREVFRILLGLLPPRSSLQEKGAWWWMNAQPFRYCRLHYLKFLWITAASESKLFFVLPLFCLHTLSLAYFHISVCRLFAKYPHTVDKECFAHPPSLIFWRTLCTAVDNLNV